MYNDDRIIYLCYLSSSISAYELNLPREMWDEANNDFLNGTISQGLRKIKHTKSDMLTKTKKIIPAHKVCKAYLTNKIFRKEIWKYKNVLYKSRGKSEKGLGVYK